MDNLLLGTTGVETSRVILGCGTFGGIGGGKELVGKGLDREASFEVLDEALKLGIYILDTAERYAEGASETMIGEWLRTLSREEREGIQLATKVGPPWVDGPKGIPFDQAYIESKLGNSLERLGVERVTFYLSHAPDETTPIETTLEGFAAVIEAGKVGHIGCSNVSATQLIEALETSDRLGIPAFGWVQNGYSLLSPDGDREVRAICRERGLGYTPFSPLAGGVLTGKYKRGQPFPEGTRMALRPDGIDELLSNRVYDALEQLEQMAHGKGLSCATLALAWLLTNPDCTAPVVGPSRSVPHLQHVAEALEVSLSDTEYKQIAEWFILDDVDAR